MTLAEETAPPQDIQKLLEGLETGKFYAPDESPWAGDFSDFFKLAQKIKARKKFEEYPELHREEYIAGAPYATTPRHWTQNLLPTEQDIRSLWTFGTGGGEAAMQLAGLTTPGAKGGIMTLAALKKNPKYAEIIRDLPKSVYEKFKRPLTSRVPEKDQGIGYLSYMNPDFAVERILAPALGSLKKSRDYKYVITADNKHWFKHKTNGSYKSIPKSRTEITNPESLLLPDKSKKAVFKRRQDDVKKADLVKDRKIRLQLERQAEEAADDLFQLRDPTLPADVRAAVLKHYERYSDRVKQEAIRKLELGGPGGGAGAGLPSLLSKKIGKIKAWSPSKVATDKKWTSLSITDESGKKVLGQVRNIPASPGNSYIKVNTNTPEGRQFQKYLIDNQIGRQSKTVDSQFFLDIDGQKAINKLLNKPPLHGPGGGPAGGSGAGLPAINYWKNYLEKYPLLGRPIPKRIEGTANKILIPESAADRAARVDKLYKQMDMTPVDIDKFLYQDLENIKKPKRNWKTLKTIIKSMLKKE